MPTETVKTDDRINKAYLEAVERTQADPLAVPHTDGQGTLQALKTSSLYRLHRHGLVERATNLWVSDKTWAAWPSWLREHLVRECAQDTGNFTLPFPTFVISSLDRYSEETERGGGSCKARWERDHSGKKLGFNIVNVPNASVDDDAAWLVVLHELGHARNRSLQYRHNKVKNGNIVPDDFVYSYYFYDRDRYPNPIEELSADYVAFQMATGIEGNLRQSLRKRWIQGWKYISGDGSGRPWDIDHASAPFLSGLIKLSEYEHAMQAIEDLAANELRATLGSPAQYKLKKAAAGIAKIPPTATGYESVKRRLLLGYAAVVSSNFDDKEARKIVKNERLFQEIRATQWMATSEELVAFGQQNPFLWDRMANKDRPDRQPAAKRPQALPENVCFERARAAA